MLILSLSTARGVNTVSHTASTHSLPNNSKRIATGRNFLSRWCRGSDSFKDIYSERWRMYAFWAKHL
jgi:hypothetical protein